MPDTSSPMTSLSLGETEQFTAAYEQVGADEHQRRR